MLAFRPYSVQTPSALHVQTDGFYIADTTVGLYCIQRDEIRRINLSSSYLRSLVDFVCSSSSAGSSAVAEDALGRWLEPNVQRSMVLQHV